MVFSNYKIFDDVNAAYSDLFLNITTVIGKITPFKTKRVKGNTYKWFDGEFLEKLTLEINFFRNLENLNPQLFKKEKYEVLKLIATKSQVFFKEKISESIYKQKEL